ncbi:Molybdopterin molybdenumtransferase [Roseovarius sp. THAF9]|nr:Molybdopterin molybdenumtransferase [Roseovarius sp. THAF9]
MLLTFDFPFGYPLGFAKALTGEDDPFAVWDWIAERIEDKQDTERSNNRFEVAEEMNRKFSGLGPFWGKSHEDRWPDLPYRKAGISYDTIPEKRECDKVARTASSCFQLFYNPTVGSQVLMGLPMLNRLRTLPGVAVWPFEEHDAANVVLAEIWPGLIEDAIREDTGGVIRDALQVTRLALALSRLDPARLEHLLKDLPYQAREEAWILGAGATKDLTELARGEISVVIPARPNQRVAGNNEPLAPPPLRDDCFALPAGVDWTPVDDALAMLQDRLHPVVATQTLPLDRALGRTLAADVTAKRANPPHANTAVDGYGFAHASLTEGDQTLPLTPGRAAAGKAFEGAVPHGHAIRILTGAALPQGVDTVILQEDVTASDTAIAFHPGIKPGANTRKAGEDVSAGDTILSKGRKLTPTDLALLSATGNTDLTVHAPLRVAVLSTGDELVEPGASAAPGQIFDANRPMLLGLTERFGFTPIDLGRVPDNRETLRATLDRGAAKADVILTSGGASSGDEDHVSALLNETGAMSQWRIAVKPGRPLALGLWKGTPVFGLPGNPVAALVCTLVFARPAMGLLSGQGWHRPQSFTLPAAFSKSKKPGRREYLRARVTDGQAEVFKSEGSGRISGLSWAEGLVELPDHAVTISPGDPVSYIPFASFL